MSFVLGVVAVTLAGLFLWGLVSPRSQWRVLVGWAVSDPYTHEPGGSGYGVRRLLSALGLAGLAVAVAVGASPQISASFSADAAPRTPVEVMWGDPGPHLVPRVVYGVPTLTPEFVAMPVLAYQSLERADDGLPGYLLTLENFRMLGRSDIPGMIGSAPAPGLSPFTSASLVVNVRGPLLCIPRQAIVVETETAVQIGIFYGLPDRPDGAPLDHAGGCPAGDPLTASVLIPIGLSAPLGDRDVQLLDGTPVPGVAVVGD